MSRVARTGVPLAALIAFGWLATGAGGEIVEHSRRLVPRYVDRVADDVILNPLFVPAMLVLFLVEHRWPARTRGRSWRASTSVDVVWTLGHAFFDVAFVLLWIGLLAGLYSRVLPGWRFDLIAPMPAAVALVVAVLVKDLCQYTHHVVRHRITVLWYFHAVHHSQDELSAFSRDRMHFVEFLVMYVFAFIPFYVLGIEAHLVAVFYVAEGWYGRFCHTNARTNLGPLRYLLVTPQSHRIHHSLEPRHRQKNFGVLFTLWDQVFGTQYRGWDEYPATGIDDDTFPLRVGSGAVGAVRSYGAQIVYPFRQVGRRLGRSARVTSWVT